MKRSRRKASSIQDSNADHMQMEINKLKQTNSKLLKVNSDMALSLQEARMAQASVERERLYLQTKLLDLNYQNRTLSQNVLTLKNRLGGTSESLQNILTHVCTIANYASQEVNRNIPLISEEEANTPSNNVINNNCAHLSVNKSQAKNKVLVKPMVGGHVIENPIINLRRLQPGDLERLANSSQSSQENSTDSNHNSNELSIDNVEQEEESLDVDLPNTLSTVHEVDENITQSSSSCSINANILNFNMRVIIEPLQNVSMLNNQQIDQPSEETNHNSSLHLSNERHVNVNKRRRVSNEDMSSSVNIETDSSAVNDSTLVNNVGSPPAEESFSRDNWSSVNEESDVEYQEKFNLKSENLQKNQSTPNKNLFRKSRCETNLSITPRLITTRRCYPRKDSPFSTATMAECSVMLERLVSPKKSRSAELPSTSAAELPSTFTAELPSTSTAELSSAATPKRGRPRRVNAPKNLKEPRANRKMRRP